MAFKLKVPKSTIPTKPGFYWALWLTATEVTHEVDNFTPANDWEVVEVWENFIGDACEADKDEKFGVSVPGVRETQWLENFKWGKGPLVMDYLIDGRAFLAQQEV